MEQIQREVLHKVMKTPLHMFHRRGWSHDGDQKFIHEPRLCPQVPILRHRGGFTKYDHHVSYERAIDRGFIRVYADINQLCALGLFAGATATVIAIIIFSWGERYTILIIVSEASDFASTDNATTTGNTIHSCPRRVLSNCGGIHYLREERNSVEHTIGAILRGGLHLLDQGSREVEGSQT